MNTSALPRGIVKRDYFFLKKKFKKFPCKQTKNKGITAVTMIMKPWTCKSHRREWWLLKCSILTKVQTSSNTEHTRRNKNHSKPQPHWHWTMTCSAPARSLHPPALHRRTPCPCPPSPSEGDRFRLHPGQSTCITGPISRSMFINMYKSVTGT